MGTRRVSRIAPLQDRLALHRFVCREFGYDDLGGMLGRLGPACGEIAPGGEIDYAQALPPWPARARVSPDRIAEYDAAILACSRRLRMTGEDGRTWKPHQYLALLFTEHYLRRYFDDPEALRADLNHSKRMQGLYLALPDYQPDDLRVLAFQSATGSGKTLLMHAHVLQYRRRLDRAGGRLNNVVLLTPNEQMSAQHERDLAASGLRARRFSSAAAADLFSPIEIIDLNKLAEKKGVKRVAVSDFGDDNLVLVDEGHLGASGKVWRERRKELSRGGFTFEYSATFNQVTGGKDPDLLRAYGKCLLFDYPYRQFHADGYGKDYAILNLPGGAQDENADMYLLGCLLTFHQQYWLWREHGARWRAFNPARPLWVLLGKTVSGSSRADRATRSDVARILNFLGWLLAHGDAVRPMIGRLLAGQSGLLDESGRDFFAGRLPHLPRGADRVYADLCDTLFHGPGRLHVVYLTAGEGELHLRTADHEPFGVVNVGDSAALHKLLLEAGAPDFDVDREMGFAKRLFADVDRPGSPVNVVIGARRFIAGWNSWRVSTMGLMHVGVGEGPEIIQMFGRGVRLQGWNTSLRRHRESGAAPPPDGDKLAELETLYVFGLRADYMRTFRELLRNEGVRAEQETFALPVTWNFARRTDLKLIRLRDDARYDRSAERLVLPGPGEAGLPLVALDLYSHLQSEASGAGSSREEAEAEKQRVSLARHAAFFDAARVHERLLRRKRRRGWRNLVVERRTVERLLRSGDWYELHLPPERSRPARFRDVRRLEDVALDLLTEYADRFWRRERRRWEHGRIEIVSLHEDDPNHVRSWALSVDARGDALVEEARGLADALQEGRLDDVKYWCDGLKIGVVRSRSHAYEPLLHVRKDRAVTVRPVPLDDNERRVVHGLERIARGGGDCLRGRELFLIRNLTRGRGVSFFDDFGYYPDFIVWLKDGGVQHVLFLDPKGLSRFGARERRKVALHREIRGLERRLHRDDPNLHLRACVLSVTPASRIDDGRRSARDWRRDGVYFLDDPGCLEQAIRDALEPAAGA